VSTLRGDGDVQRRRDERRDAEPREDDLSPRERHVRGATRLTERKRLDIGEACPDYRSLRLRKAHLVGP